MSFTVTEKSRTNMSTTKLTDEQIKRMEENRRKALERKAQLSNQQQAPKVATLSSINSSSSSTAPQSSNGFISNQANAPKPTHTNNNDSSGLTGKCQLLADDPENRFEIIIGFNKNLIEMFKTINSRKYDPDTKRWNFSLKSYDEIMCRIKHEFNNTIKLEPLDRSNKKSIMVKFCLINNQQFEAQVDYNQELMEIFKSMKTKKYDPNTKRWSFNLNEYEELISNIRSKMGQSVNIVQLPKIVKETFKEKLTNTQEKQPLIDLDHLRLHVDPTIVKTLLPFQVESICFAIRQQGRLLLADDMGLGKTLQGLAIASYYKNEWPLFIITPSSVKFMWKQSAQRWVSNTIRKLCYDCSDVEEYIQVIENSRQPINTEAKIVISSYDLLSKNIDEISRHEFKVVIADESHLLKTSKAQRTKSAARLMQTAKRVILLSGTPALSRPSELFSQLQIINPSVFKDFHEFGMRYCAGKETHFGYDYSGFSNMTELRTILEEKVLIRREKKDVMSQLPSKIREQIILDPGLIELNTKSLKQASNLMKEENLKGMEKRGALLAYFQETSKVKVAAVCEYVNDLLETGKKFLVFAHHQNMLNEIEAVITKNKYDFIRIDGSTNSEKRQALVDKFQNDDECLCALLSITAASTGLTLTKATLVVFGELFWNPGILSKFFSSTIESYLII